MAAAIRLQAASVEPPPLLQVQLLPCRIGTDGPAPVASFLRPQRSADGALLASFRGRRLAGRDLALPGGFRGLLLREGESPPGPTDPQPRGVSVAGSFDAIREWGADTAPSGGLQRALQWAPLAQAIHSPVPDTEDEEEEE
ncbi:RNH2C Ribonuclease, partial [Ramphastos sulfuratus]|nr:RNH2C Ribonuclease [Ramphastos sulfuratus]